MASVKVAVRVRPFNQREIDLNSDTIIDMVENKTTISNPKIPEASEGDFSREKRKEFTYDYSYWSLEKQRNNFASQLRVFDDIGRGVIQSAFEGYNCCIFAYGQTGSGKSYTMMGAPGTDDEGLIPRICQGLFEGMQEKNDLNSSFRTEVSYLEIYNERVRDLLKVNKGMYSLRVREHPKDGPYVQDLSKHLVMDYGDIFTLMDRGNSVRTTASTNMNDVSSRSHAIFTIKFIQAKLVNDLPSETVSKIHLVDLAGSERADASGATGQRLKEGGSINKSLVSLGNVISTLADMSGESGKGRRFFVPYRDSVLTWLLKDSIGGNSKTIMIATISPASVNYAETLSTLRYANRAKNIINKPTINEDPNVKLIRELQAEIARLKDLLGGNVNLRNTQVEERLHENESRVKMLTDEWQEKWREMGMLQMDHRLALRKEGAGIVLDSELPHLVGVDDDLLSTGVIFFNLSEGQTRLGLDDRLDVVLKGADVLTEHCILQNDAGVVTLLPAEGAICYVDGVRVQGPTRLFQGAVLVFGRTNKFRFNHPEEARKLRSEGMWGAGMNLSRISLLSQSYNDLSTDNIVTDGEERQKKEHELLEAKRREIHQLEQSFQQMEQQRHVEEQKHEESIEDKRHELEQLRREISALKQERRAQMLKRLAVLSPEQRGSYEQLQKQFVALYDEENNLAVQQNTAKERLQQDSQQAEQSATDEALRLRTALAAQEEQLRQAKETVEQARKKQAEARTELSSTRSRLAVEEERLQELRSSFEAKMAELEGKGQSFEDYVAEEKKDIDKMWNALQLIEQSRKSTYDEIEAEIKDMEAKMLVEYDEELNAAVRSSEENEAAQEELKSLLANCTNPDEEEQLRHRLQLLEDEHNRLLAQKDAADTKRRNMEDEIRHEWEGLDHLRDRDREDLEEDRRQLTEQEAALNWPQRIEEKQMRILQLKDELLSRDVDLEDTDDVARQRQTEFDRLAIQVAEMRAAMTQSEIEIGRRLELEQSRVGAELRALEDERRKVVERITAERKEVELKLESLEDSLCPAEPLRRLSVLEEQSELDRHSVESRRAEMEQGHGEKESMERQRHSVELDRLSDPDDSREDREQNITLPDTSTPTGQPSLRHAISLPGLVISGVMDLSPDSSWEAKRSRYIQQINASLRWSVNDDVRLDVEIPSYLRRGYGVDVHYEYEVRLTVNHERWSVFRRYSKFLELHRFLKKRHVSLQSLPFPPKRFLFNRSDRFLAQRRSQLEMYLRELLRRLVEDAHSPLNPERLRLSGTPLSKRVMCDFNEFFQKGNFETSKHEMG